MNTTRITKLLFVLSLLMLLVPELYPVALLRSFALQLFLLAIALCGIFIVRKRFRLSVVSLTSALLILCLLPVDLLLKVNDTGHYHLRVAHFNVLKFNKDYSETIRSALVSDADLISFQEVDSQWADKLYKGLHQQYPYSRTVSQESCCYGIAVYSRYPMSDVGSFTITGLPNIAGEVESPHGTVHFIASHTKSPTSPGNYRQRNRHIRYLSDYVDSVSGPVIAVGDYNGVPWDSVIIDFMTETQLADSRKDLSPTYPSWLWPALIPIDYIFHSKELRCLQFSTIKNTSSDHYGVVGDYRFINGGQLAALTHRNPKP